MGSCQAGSLPWAPVFSVASQQFPHQHPAATPPSFSESPWYPPGQQEAPEPSCWTPDPALIPREVCVPALPNLDLCPQPGFLTWHLHFLTHLSLLGEQLSLSLSL